MPSDPLTDARGLEVGDVLMCAIKLVGKHDGKEYWWKTFRIVTEPTVGIYARLMILKLHPDLDKDVRNEAIVFTSERVFTKVEDHEMPQGVIAMRMKAIHTGLVVPF